MWKSGNQERKFRRGSFRSLSGILGRREHDPEQNEERYGSRLVPEFLSST
jgi:hypothetical protein